MGNCILIALRPPVSLHSAKRLARFPRRRTLCLFYGAGLKLSPAPRRRSLLLPSDRQEQLPLHVSHSHWPIFFTNSWRFDLVMPFVTCVGGTNLRYRLCLKHFHDMHSWSIHSGSLLPRRGKLSASPHHLGLVRGIGNQSRFSRVATSFHFVPFVFPLVPPHPCHSIEQRLGRQLLPGNSRIVGLVSAESVASVAPLIRLLELGHSHTDFCPSSGISHSSARCGPLRALSVSFLSRRRTKTRA